MAMISGHTFIIKEQFEQHYIPKIQKCISDGYIEFYVGGARGVDTLAQEYLSGIDNVKVTVVDAKKQNNNLFPEKFSHQSLECGYEQRDKYMTEITKIDIAFLAIDPFAAGSGTAANLIRRKFGHNIAKKVQTLIRDTGASGKSWKEAVLNKFPNEGRDIVELLESKTCIEL
jgi:hypothetical protein